MLAFLGLVLLIVIVLEWATFRDPLRAVRYDARTDKRSVDVDEPFTIESTIENGRRLPIAFLRVTENLPPEMALKNLPPRYAVELPPNGLKLPLRLVSTAYLGPKQKLTRKVSATLPRRGRYFLRGAELTGGDFLGLAEEIHTYSCYNEIVVLPKRADCAAETEALGGFLGDISVRRFIMEDPVLTLGFRDYTGREPQKQIAWTQSLRTGKLLVKEYDHTLEPAVTVLLNVSAAGEDRFLRIERAFSLARTVCETLEKKRIQYSFLTNAMAAGALGLWSSITVGLGRNHLLAILEGLGRATYDPAESFLATLERAARMAEQGRSHIIISPDNGEAFQKGVGQLLLRTGGANCVIIAEAPCEKEA